MKIRLKSFPTIVIIPLLLCGLALFAYTPLGIAPNIGLPFGYYGDFNEIKAEVAKYDEFSIKKTAQHRDFDLEDFWITIETSEGRTFTLEIIDGSNVRDKNDEADGVMVSPKGYRIAAFFPFEDEIWSFSREDPPSNIEDLLPLMDDFLDNLEGLEIPYKELDWERSRSFIRIIYKKGEQAAFPKYDQRSAAAFA